MRIVFKRLAVMAILGLFGLLAHAAEQNSKALQDRISKALEGIPVDSIKTDTEHGLIEVMAAGRVLYTTPDGRFLINGVMFDLSNGRNVTEMRMAELEKQYAPMRAKELKALGEASMIVFPAAKQKHVLTVFTDIDCGYCRRLHQSMSALNEKGITVRYVGFPRAGLGSESYTKLVSVWCSADRKQAMNDAKLNNKITAKACTHPIDKHMALVRKFGITGTPTMILDDGRMIPGFMPPDELAALLDKKGN